MHIGSATQVLTAILHVIIIYRCVISYFVLVSDRMVGAHETLMSILLLLYKLIFLSSLWRHENGFLELLNYVQESEIYNSASRIRVRVGSFFLCAVYLFMGIGSTVAGHGLFPINEWSLSLFLRMSSKEGRVLLWMNPAAAVKFEFFPCAIHTVTSFYKHVIALYSDLCLLMGALMFRHLALQFKDSIKESRERALDAYANLKRITDKINSVFGIILLGCLLEELVYYAVFVGDLLVVTDWLAQVRYTFYLVGFLCALFVSANTAQKISTIQDLIGDESLVEQFPTSRLVLLVGDLNRHRIGLSAMGLFTITYGFIGTVSRF